MSSGAEVGMMLLDKGTRPPLSGMIAGDLFQRWPVQDLESAVFPTDRIRGYQSPNRLVGVDQRQTQRVGYVLLRKWKLYGPISGQARIFCPYK